MIFRNLTLTTCYDGLVEYSYLWIESLRCSLHCVSGKFTVNNNGSQMCRPPKIAHGVNIALSRNLHLKQWRHEICGPMAWLVGCGERDPIHRSVNRSARRSRKSQVDTVYFAWIFNCNTLEFVFIYSQVWTKKSKSNNFSL